MSNDQFYKPGSIWPPVLEPGYFYNSVAYNSVGGIEPYGGPDPIPLGATIIDQATFLNAEPAGPWTNGPDPDFVPTEYIATQDTTSSGPLAFGYGHSITHLDIGVSNMYGGFNYYRTVNTDHMIVLTHPTLGVGVDVYDPAAIMAGINLSAWNTSAPCGFYLLAATVVSILDASQPRTLQKLRPKSVIAHGAVTVRNLSGAAAAGLNWGTAVFENMSTTERNALTPSSGWVIYNSTSHTFQGYANGAWVDFH